MKTNLKRQVFALFLTLIFWAYADAQNNESPVSELYQLMNEMAADYGSLERFYIVQSSPEKRARFQEFYQDYLSRLGTYNFNKLSVEGQVDYLLTKRDIERALRTLTDEKEEYTSIEDWVSYGDPIYQIEKLRRRGTHLKSSEVAAELNSISEALDKLTIALGAKEPFLDRRLAERAQDVIKGHQTALKSVYEFYYGYDPEFTWWMEKPYEKLTAKLQEYDALVMTKIDKSTQPKDDGSGIIGNPIGAKELKHLLEEEFIPYSAEELVAIANKEFAWCDKELLKASREMGFGDDWKAAQEKVKQSYVPEGYQPEAMYELYKQSVDFLKKNDLLSIPPMAEETWRMSMMSPERQKIAPFFLGGEVLQISYPTNTMDHDDKMMSMRGNNPHFSRATVHHELIAGHHLQGFMNRRFKPYRHFRTPFWTEGWALYWELVLWDMDFPRSPEDRIGMLFWRMHRCARIIFSLNYHLGKWTPQECIDYLVDRVGHERANAEGEVRRSFTARYGPLYQLAYMVGGMQFYALKKELVDTGKMSYKEYHDAVLRENSMPVEMVRAILTDQSLNKNYKTSWDFYKD
ncbi:DUF885 family protein [Robertkochia solimangrovi]|uniref:DUF885 family protein n=1 Tax=Robertkochia solimangrovi TaxID=2213046 RepID=UPI00117DAB98|nr:DUF885 family protein [Robertkochia solimangrovi]TRZ45087.1 DUF885 domain-containing protein [Robertkochia solimangrovi]